MARSKQVRHVDGDEVDRGTKQARHLLRSSEVGEGRVWLAFSYKRLSATSPAEPLVSKERSLPQVGGLLFIMRAGFCAF